MISSIEVSSDVSTYIGFYGKRKENLVRKKFDCQLRIINGSDGPKMRLQIIIWKFPKKTSLFTFTPNNYRIRQSSAVNLFKYFTHHC